MMPRRLSLILPIALLPALFGCHGANTPTPLSAVALAAVSQNAGKHGGPAREQLARGIDALFSSSEAGETRALLVLHNGQIIAERYAPGYDQTTRFAGWSMSKCVTGGLIGLLVADGRLRLDEPVPIPAWQRPGDPRGEVTLRHLLQMRAGLRHREEAKPVSDADTVRMLFLDGRDDMAGYAEAQPLETEAGSQWRYSTATSIILSDIAARTLTDSHDAALRRQAVSDYLHTRLLEPIGLHSMVPEFDAAGTLIGGSMVHASARDWGRLGEFLRNGGSVKGAQIVPSDWIRFMVTPSPANPGYGAQLWLNHPQPDGHQELFPARAPASLFACIGHLGQYVVVSPSQHLTIVRLGKSDQPERPALRDRLADIVQLFTRD